jgi:hypothetical protein
MPTLAFPPCSGTKAMGLPSRLTGFSGLTALDLSDNPLDGIEGTGGGLAALADLSSLQVGGWS